VRQLLCGRQRRIRLHQLLKLHADLHT
jgi:hypothetical protein